MRILLSIHHPLDRNSGASGVVMRLAEQYEALGHSVRIASFDDMPRVLPSVVRRALFPFVLSRIARRWKPDVVDASSGDGWYCFTHAPRPAPLRITHSHGLEHLSAKAEIDEAREAGRKRGLVKRLWRHGGRLRFVARSFRAADVCFVLNQSEADFLREHLAIDGACIHRTQLGTDHAGRQSSRPPPEEPRRIVQIGSFIARKGIGQTVPAVTEVLRSRPRALMLFAGTGPITREILERFPAELRDRVSVVPAYRNADLPDLIEDAAVCLMPSTFEGYGIAKIEAMACGVVPITSNDPGSATDIADGEDGIVVARGNTAQLRDAILALLDDPECRNAMAERARSKASGFSWRKAASDRIAFYEQGLARLRGEVRAAA